MNLHQVAAQLYTVRDHLKTPREIAASLRKLRAIGYEAVQASGLGPIDDSELARILKNEGLACCATHEDGELLFANPERVIEKLQKLDCRITTYPWPGANPPFGSVREVSEFARKLNTAGEAFHKAGITFCYHNHHMEFRRVAGRTVLEALYAETDARFVQAELDTYWVQFGGGDPADWCKRMKDRLVVLHMKDYAINTKNEVVFAEVGSGNLNWPAIIAAAEESGCRWFVPEQDVCPRDPFESLKQSFQFIRANLCGK